MHALNLAHDHHPMCSKIKMKKNVLVHPNRPHRPTLVFSFQNIRTDFCSSLLVCPLSASASPISALFPTENVIPTITTRHFSYIVSLFSLVSFFLLFVDIYRMAEPHQGNGSNTTSKLPGETRDCGIFDCFGKKQYKPEEDSVMTDHETATVLKPHKMKEDQHTLNVELHRSRSNSSSSSYEEGEGGEKKRKKKQLKEKGKEMEANEKEEGEGVEEEHNGVSIPLEKCDQVGNAEPTQQDEKKGFLEKIKEKLPRQHKKAKEVSPGPPPDQLAADGNSPGGGEAKDKKGILDKIKEKLPGYNKNDGDETKTKEN